MICPLDIVEIAPPIEQSNTEAGQLWFADGVFYARVQVDGENQPLTVALHGVSTGVQAAVAYQALLAQDAGAGGVPAAVQ